MAVDDFARLERFRRVAREHKLKISESGLPVEEIDQLRNQLNAVVYLQAKPWMLPAWAALDIKGIDVEESLITEYPNDSYRNWSLVGGVGGYNYGIVDTRGLTSARADIGSVDIWLQEDEEIIFPALIGKDGPQLQLVSTEDQLYEWRTEVKSIEFVRLIYHVKQGDEEFVYNEVALRNIALERKEITFYVVIRPMSPWGVDPLEKIEFNESERLVLVNGIPALQFDTPPTAVILTESNNVDIPDSIRVSSTRLDTVIESAKGLATAILRFDVKLTAAGTKRLYIVSPLESVKKDIKKSKLNVGPHNRDLTVGNWYSFSEQLTKVLFPDSQLDKVFSQAAVSLAIQARSVMFPEESYLASFTWKERMRVLVALIKTGSFELAERLTIEIAQQSDVPKGPLDRSTFSPILWGLLQLYSHTPKSESISEIRKYITQLTERLVDALTIKTDEDIVSGPIEDALEEDEEDVPLQHYLIVDETLLMEFNQLLWDLAALKESLRFHVVTKKPIVNLLRDAITKTKEKVRTTLDEIRGARWPRPQDPIMNSLDRIILDILTSVAQLRTTKFDLRFLRDLCNRVEDRRIVRNLWKTPEPLELFSSHLTLRLAQFHIFDRQRKKVETYLQRSLEFLSEDFLLPDFVDTRTYGGSGGTGSSVLAAADIILLLNDILVHEDVSNLVFLPGVPEQWYSSKRPLLVQGLPTKFGRARIEIGMSSNQHQIETGIEYLPEEIEIHVPESVPLRMVKAYGASIVDRAAKSPSPHLRLVPLSNEVVLTYHK
ncbi:MAG: hypothetical protein ACXAAO_02690 [Candidatus Thorarchaeota archaeon]